MMLDQDLKSVQEVRGLIRRSKKAQKNFSKFSQKEIDRIIKELADIAYQKADYLAKLAVDDTEMGKYEDKVIKNILASRNLYKYIKDMQTVGIINEDQEKKIIEVATPVGVIAALVPSTNPTSTAIYKTLIALKSGNSIIFSPHPSAKESIKETIKILSEKLIQLGAPKDLISCMSITTMEGTNELMTHKDVALILATGGSGMVKTAYSSGTPALGVGPGNVPAFIERSADITLAVKRIIASKTFDYGTVCASEQSIVVEDCIAQEVKEELKRQGAYFLDEDEAKKVATTIQKQNGALNAKIVGQSVSKIAKMADIDISSDIKVLIYEENGIGIEYPFSREKLSPILAFYTVKDWEKGCQQCIDLLEYGGLGHSLGIHSNNEEVIKEFALRKPASRILVNTSTSQGGVGGTTNLAPAFTLGCGTIGGSATSDNVTPLNLINIRRVAYGVREAEDLRSEHQNKGERKEFKGRVVDSIDIDLITKKVLAKLKQL